jgi:hypothetical protein
VLAIGHDPPSGERRVDALTIGEQQRVADVEEDDFDFRIHGIYHSPIIRPDERDSAP